MGGAFWVRVWRVGGVTVKNDERRVSQRRRVFFFLTPPPLAAPPTHPHHPSHAHTPVSDSSAADRSSVGQEAKCFTLRSQVLDDERVGAERDDPDKGQPPPFVHQNTSLPTLGRSTRRWGGRVGGVCRAGVVDVSFVGVFWQPGMSMTRFRFFASLPQYPPLPQNPPLSPVYFSLCA